MGMMNNGWYIVKPEISEKDDGIAKILFGHPTEPGTKDGGWMQLSESEKINEASKQLVHPRSSSREKRLRIIGQIMIAGLWWMGKCMMPPVYLNGILVEKLRLQAMEERYGRQQQRSSNKLGLQTCRHIQFGFHFIGQMLIRSYTPTRPVTEKEDDGTFDLVVKTYFPDKKQLGGAMSNILDYIPIGKEIEIRGPTGEITYQGNSKFIIEDKEFHFFKIPLILGGSGFTPGYALIARILSDANDKTQIRVMDVNKSEAEYC
jgi:hypothetical protein